MKKIIALILEINNASFAWYAVFGVFLFGVAYAYPAALRDGGISLRGVAWFIGISALLRGYDSAFGWRKSPMKRMYAPQTILERLRWIALSVGGSVVIIWALFAYHENNELYVLLKDGGIPMLWSGIMLFILYWCIVIGAINETKLQEAESASIPDMKNIYAARREFTNATRLSKQFPVRWYAHEAEYRAIAALIGKGERILDAGCGDGTLAILLAKKGAIVVACDISSENIAAARVRTRGASNETPIAFLTADAEHLPFPDDSFDCVVSSHVLEHLPSFEKGLAEIRRITKKRAVIALPTCMNPCAAIILGNDSFWTLSRWSATAWFVGALRILLNLGGAGVNEWYGGDERLPHLWRYPWVMRRDIKKGGFCITRFQASSFALPYMERLISVSKSLEKYNALPILRNFGYGSIAVVEK